MIGIAGLHNTHMRNINYIIIVFKTILETSHLASSTLFQVVNLKDHGSVDDVYVYSMFEATDSWYNMNKCWAPFYPEQVIEV